MWSSIGKSVAKAGAQQIATPLLPASTSVASLKLEGDYGSGCHHHLQPKQSIETISKQDKVVEILRRVKARDGLPEKTPHLTHLVGRVSQISDMPGLQLGDKTEFVMKSLHPVRHVLEREFFNTNTQNVSYHDWLTLFGRAMRGTNVKTNSNSKYEEVLSFISKGADSGMFSSTIHSSIVDMPDRVEVNNSTTSSRILDQYFLGNKYATLVGDYFAIRCIHFIEQAKQSQVFMEITNGLGQFATATFTPQFLDLQTIYPLLPLKSARVENWIQYSHKSSGYFTGGLNAIMTQNLKHHSNFGREGDKSMLRRFSSNLAVLLKGIEEIEMLQNVHQFSSIPSSILLTLPSVLHQQKHPNAFDLWRRQKLNSQANFSQIAEEISSSAAMDEALSILEEMALDTNKSFEELATDEFYADVFYDLVSNVANFR